MKKSIAYVIDFATNTVTVTKKFAEAASQIAPLPEFHTMMQLREMTLTIVTNAPSKKNTQLTYGDSSILLWSDIQQHGVGALRPFPHPIGCIVPCIIINRISHRIPQI